MNLANFKRRLKVGVKLACIFHQESAGRDEKGVTIYVDKDRGIREVSIVQTNSFALKTQKTDGTWHDAWCEMPKASECKFPDENTIVIHKQDYRQPDTKPLIPILTYRFV